MQQSEVRLKTVVYKEQGGQPSHGPASKEEGRVDQKPGEGNGGPRCELSWSLDVKGSVKGGTQTN